MEPDTYINTRITGPVSVEQVTKKLPPLAGTILLVGSTGTGKSNFIECLSGGSVSGIAKNQLEGFTQDITAYKVINFKPRHPGSIYVIDAPGFADRKISELKIVNMIREWIEKNPYGMGHISFILYFDRITDIRLPGSQRRLMHLFRQLTGNPTKTAKAVTIVTTMWDEICNDTQRDRAEKRFEQLKNEHWKDLLDGGAHITKFDNTQESAIKVLQEAFRFINSGGWPGLDVKMRLQEGAAAPLIYHNLAERIEALQQRLRTVEDELQQEQAELDISEQDLIDILIKEKNELEQDLRKFGQEIEDFGELPPVPEVQSSIDNNTQIASDGHSGRRVRRLFSKTKGLIKDIWHADENSSN